MERLPFNGGLFYLPQSHSGMHIENLRINVLASYSIGQPVAEVADLVK
jgi:hypothetical protein